MYIVHPVQAVFFVAIMDSLHSQSNGACIEHILTLSCEFWSDYEIKDTSSWGPQVVSELADFDKHINEKLRFLNLFFHKAGDPPSLHKRAFILLGTGSTYWRTIYHIYPQMTIPSTRQPSVLITLYNFTLWVSRYGAENGKEGHCLVKIGRWKRAWRTHTCLDLSLEITWGQYSDEIQCIGIVCNCIGNGGRVKKLQRMEVPRFNLPGTSAEI